jgi:hypothetical protein
MALARVHGAWLEQRCLEASLFSSFLNPVGERRYLIPT